MDQTHREAPCQSKPNLGEAMFGADSLQTLNVEVEDIDRRIMSASQIADFLQLDAKIEPRERLKKCYVFADEVPLHLGKCKVPEVNTLLFRLMGNIPTIISELLWA